MRPLALRHTPEHGEQDSEEKEIAGAHFAVFAVEGRKLFLFFFALTLVLPSPGSAGVSSGTAVVSGVGIGWLEGAAMVAAAGLSPVGPEVAVTDSPRVS